MTQNPSKAPTSCTPTRFYNREDYAFQYNIAMNYALAHIPILQTAVRNKFSDIPEFYRRMYHYPVMDIPANPPEVIMESDQVEPGFDFTVASLTINDAVQYYIIHSRITGATMIRDTCTALRDSVLHAIDEYLRRNQLPGYGVYDIESCNGSIYWHIPLQES